MAAVDQTLTTALTSAGQGPSSPVEIDDSSFELPPPPRLEDARGHAAQRGVGHMHGGAGLSLDDLHPVHHPVQQVDAMAQAQSVSHVTLDTHTAAVVSTCSSVTAVITSVCSSDLSSF